MTIFCSTRHPHQATYTKPFRQWWTGLTLLCLLISPLSLLTRQSVSAHELPDTPVDSKSLNIESLDLNALESGLQDDELITPQEQLNDVPLLLSGMITKVENMPIDPLSVITLVEDQNIWIRQTELTAKSQKAVFYKKLSDFLPDFEASYSHSRFNGGIQIFGNQVVKIYQTRITPELRVALRVYPGGRTVFESVAEYRRAKAQKRLLRDMIQDQLTNALNEYFNLQEAWATQNNVVKTIQDAEGQVRLNNSRLQAGVGTKLELMQAKSDLAKREQELIQAENTTQQAEEALLNRLYLDGGIHLMPEATIRPLDLTPTQPIELLMEKTVDDHPEVRQLDIQAKALFSDMMARVSDIVPVVDLEAYSNWQGPAHHQLQLGRYGGIRVTANLLENSGFAIPLDARKLYLDYKAKKAERDAKVRDIKTRITNARLNAEAYQKSIALAEQELEAAKEAYRLSLGRYKVGLNIFVDVLNAQSALATARTKLSQTVLNYNRAQFTLLNELGMADGESLVKLLTEAETVETLLAEKTN